MAGFFFTGEEAAALTPKSIERRRALLDALGKDAYSTAPVQHWTQGAARLANALANNFEETRLNKSETKGTNDANAAILAALGMGASGASSPMPAGPSAAAGGVASPSVAAPDVSRETAPPMPPVRPPAATPPPGAPAWAGAMPSVMPTGSLDQSGTMPKPPAAMAMAPGAAAEGQPSEQELVIRTIAAETSGKTPEEAQAIAAVILNRAKTRNLSPADVVLERNQFEPWNGGPGGRNDPMNISPNSPRYAQAASALQAAMGGQDPTRGATHFFAPQAQAALGRRPPAWAQGPGQQIGATAFYAPEGRAPGGNVPVSGDTPAPGAQEAQNLQRPPSGQMNIPGQQQAAPDRSQALIRALSNPWAQQANPMLAGVAQKVLGEQLTGNKLQYQTLPDGTILALDPTGRRPPTPVYQAPTKPQWGIIGEDEFGNKRYGFVDPSKQSVTPYQQPQGATNNQPGISVAPNGQPSPSIPPAPPGVNPKVWRDEQTKKLVNPDKLTEVQSKDVGFYTRGVPANDTLTKLEGSLTAAGDTAKSKVPLVGNYLVSENYQKAQNAAKDFLAVILRKDTGAAVTDGEVATYGEIFLPKPGDSAETIKQKRESRTRALEGIRLGLGTAKEVVDFAKPKGGDNKGMIDEARAAIAKGADPEKVKARLKERGIDPGAL